MCGQLRATDIGRSVHVMGWVQRRRDHGGLVFVDLRDRTGLVQIVFNPTVNAPAHEQAQQLRQEFVIAVTGTVSARPAGMRNPNLATGEVEVMVHQLEILNEAKTPPFLIEDEVDVTEAMRMKHRYLDLRRLQMQQLLRLRHEVAQQVRMFLNTRGFLDIVTTMLSKSKLVGERYYLIPNRINPGTSNALQISPHIFTQ